MAFTTTSDNPLSLGRSLLSIGRRIGQALDTFAQVHSRRLEVTRLLEMSDCQLAARGLKRDQIVQHVYSDRLGM